MGSMDGTCPPGFVKPNHPEQRGIKWIGDTGCAQPCLNHDFRDVAEWERTRIYSICLTIIGILMIVAVIVLWMTDKERGKQHLVICFAFISLTLSLVVFIANVLPFDEYYCHNNAAPAGSLHGVSACGAMGLIMCYVILCQLMAWLVISIDLFFKVVVNKVTRKFRYAYFGSIFGLPLFPALYGLQMGIYGFNGITPWCGFQYVTHKQSHYSDDVNIFFIPATVIVGFGTCAMVAVIYKIFRIQTRAPPTPNLSRKPTFTNTDTGSTFSGGSGGHGHGPAAMNKFASRLQMARQQSFMLARRGSVMIEDQAERFRAFRTPVVFLIICLLIWLTVMVCRSRYEGSMSSYDEQLKTWTACVFAPYLADHNSTQDFPSFDTTENQCGPAPQRVKPVLLNWIIFCVSGQSIFVSIIYLPNVRLGIVNAIRRLLRPYIMYCLKHFAFTENNKDVQRTIQRMLMSSRDLNKQGQHSKYEQKKKGNAMFSISDEDGDDDDSDEDDSESDDEEDDVSNASSTMSAYKAPVSLAGIPMKALKAQQIAKVQQHERQQQLQELKPHQSGKPILLKGMAQKQQYIPPDVPQKLELQMKGVGVNKSNLGLRAASKRRVKKARKNKIGNVAKTSGKQGTDIKDGDDYDDVRADDDDGMDDDDEEDGSHGGDGEEDDEQYRKNSDEEEQANGHAAESILKEYNRRRASSDESDVITNKVMYNQGNSGSNDSNQSVNIHLNNNSNNRQAPLMRDAAMDTAKLVKSSSGRLMHAHTLEPIVMNSHLAQQMLNQHSQQSSQNVQLHPHQHPPGQLQQQPSKSKFGNSGNAKRSLKDNGKVNTGGGPSLQYSTVMLQELMTPPSTGSLSLSLSLSHSHSNPNRVPSTDAGNHSNSDSNNNNSSSSNTGKQAKHFVFGDAQVQQAQQLQQAGTSSAASTPMNSSVMRRLSPTNTNAQSGNSGVGNSNNRSFFANPSNSNSVRHFNAQTPHSNHFANAPQSPSMIPSLQSPTPKHFQQTPTNAAGGAKQRFFFQSSSNVIQEDDGTPTRPDVASSGGATTAGIAAMSTPAVAKQSGRAGPGPSPGAAASSSRQRIQLPTSIANRVSLADQLNMLDLEERANTPEPSANNTNASANAEKLPNSQRLSDSSGGGASGGGSGHNTVRGGVSRQTSGNQPVPRDGSNNASVSNSSNNSYASTKYGVSSKNAVSGKAAFSMRASRKSSGKWPVLAKMADDVIQFTARSMKQTSAYTQQSLALSLGGLSSDQGDKERENWSDEQVLNAVESAFGLPLTSRREQNNNANNAASLASLMMTDISDPNNSNSNNPNHISNKSSSRSSTKSNHSSNSRATSKKMMAMRINTNAVNAEFNAATETDMMEAGMINNAGNAVSNFIYSNQSTPNSQLFIHPSHQQALPPTNSARQVPVSGRGQPYTVVSNNSKTPTGSSSSSILSAAVNAVATVKPSNISTKLPPKTNANNNNNNPHTSRRSGKSKNFWPSLERIHSDGRSIEKENSSGRITEAMVTNHTVNASGVSTATIVAVNTEQLLGESNKQLEDTATVSDHVVVAISKADFISK
jgi:hypothetical protein